MISFYPNAFVVDGDKVYIYTVNFELICIS